MSNLKRFESKRTFRTKSPENHLQSEAIQIDRAAKAVGLDDYDRSLVQDITNLEVGGVATSEDSWDDAIADQLSGWKPEQHPDPDYSDHYAQGGGWVQGRDRAFEVEEEQIRIHHRNARDFAESFDPGRFDGGSPLERAMGGLKLLKVQQQQQRGGSQDSPFGGAGSGKAAGEAVNDALDQASELDDADKSLLGETNEWGDGSPGLSHQLNNALKILELGPMMKIARHAEGTVSLQIGDASTFTEDPCGSERANRPIRSLGEIHKLTANEWAYPKSYRMYRMLTGQAQVRERFHRDAKKQIIYMLIDRSGSMGVERMQKALGILYDRLKAVIRGDAELYIRYFDDQLYPERSARTPEEAKAVFDWATTMTAAGGTEIAGALRGAVSRIDELLADDPKLVRPEIALVSDGAAPLPHVSDLGQCKLNTFIIEYNNPELTRLARQTGGIGMDCI